MKEGFRQCMAWLHTWAGLVTGWVLFFVFVTGTAGYFNFEIDRWMRPELPLAPAAAPDAADLVAKAQAHLQAKAPDAETWTIGLPGERTQPQLTVFARQARQPDGANGRTYRATLDAASGEAIDRESVRATGGGQLLYRMHYLLHYMPRDAGIWAVGICTMLMLVAIVSGVVTHKKIFADFFTFRRAKGQRSWLDAHNVVSVMALPFFLMITYSGLVFFMSTYMPAGVQATYGPGREGLQRLTSELIPDNRIAAAGRAAATVPLAEVVRQAEAQWGGLRAGSVAVRHPGDAAAVVSVRARREGGETLNTHALRFSGATGEPLPAEETSGARQTQMTLLSLHEGRFAGPALRWLYFFASLLGCAMIATGLVLWTAKRKVKQDKRLKAGQSVAFGYRLVDCLNIATVAGLCTAVAVYFWANRLIPTDFAGRREWEAHAMFIAWGALLVHAAMRPARRAWVEQLWLAALAFGLLPLVNALTTQRHLGVTVPAGDWVLAGFDLTMLALGLVFAYVVHKLHRRLTVKPARPSREPLRKASA